jgi:hypothetical protein
VKHYLYLSVVPEALVVSMLPPEEFGKYLAVGTRKRAREQAIYFELSGDLESEYFDIKTAVQLCVPHEDGRPKHSVYVSIYRVLEHVPQEAFKSLWLVTRDGLPLELKQAALPTTIEEGQHLYQELCPVHPLIASLLSPRKFCEYITRPQIRIAVPKLCFLELQLGQLLESSDKEASWNLPYKNIAHLKDCLLELSDAKKITKTVDRIHPPLVPFRCIESGFFVGDANGLLYYPFPSGEDMEKEHHKWWKSAQEP